MFQVGGSLEMRVVGFLLLLGGWFLVLASIVLFAEPIPRVAFIFAGMAIEIGGLVLVFRSHAIPRDQKV